MIYYTLSQFIDTHYMYQTKSTILFIYGGISNYSLICAEESIMNAIICWSGDRKNRIREWTPMISIYAM